MIHAVRANRKGFREVFFSHGVNMILADRSATSGDKDTTNALGKSTLIEIIDFCLGSNTSPAKGLRIEPLQGWSFTLEVTLGGNKVEVTRATDSPNVFAITGPTLGWPHLPTLDKEGTPVLDLKRWRAVLSLCYFGLDELVADHSYKPSARSLLSYLSETNQRHTIHPSNTLTTKRHGIFKSIMHFCLALIGRKRQGGSN